jgi:hypothetical protein
VDEGPVGKRRLPILAKPPVAEEEDEDEFDVDEFASESMEAV